MSQLRNISLDTILSGFNTLTDDLRDRTVLLRNARRLELQIDCANRLFCDGSKFPPVEQSLFGTLLMTGELVR